MMRRMAISLVFLMALTGLAQDHMSYLPHFTQTAGKWNTVLNLTNPDSVSAQISIEAWSVDGEKLDTAELSLAPTRGMSSSVQDLFPNLTQDKGWLTITSSQEAVKGVMMFSDITTGGESGLPLIRETGSNWVLPMLENGDERQSGFVTTNLSAEPTVLTLTLTSLDASFKKVETVQLGARSKLVSMLSGIFGDDIPQQGRLQIDSDSDLAAFALTFKNGTQQIIAVPGEAWNPGLLPAIQADVTRFYSNVVGDAGITMGIQLADKKPVVGAAGDADVRGVAMAPDSIADIGSITKTFVAALTLLLKEEGLLSLDDTLEQWITGIPNGEEITIRQMLSHTSGIYNYTNSPTFGADWGASIQAGTPLIQTPQDLVDYALAEEPLFEPGSSWEYSNTNFVLLGMIIEKATGESFTHQLRTRLLDPLGLKNTYMAGTEAVPNRARRYLDEGELLDVTDISHMSWAWAAGAMASTPEDLMKWADALYGGQVLSEASLTEMKTPARPSGQGASYGLGTLILNLNGKTAYGHDGATEGGLAFFMWVPEDGESLALTVNQRTVGMNLNPLILSGLRTAGVLKRKTDLHIEGLIELK